MYAENVEGAGLGEGIGTNPEDEVGKLYRCPRPRAVIVAWPNPDSYGAWYGAGGVDVGAGGGPLPYDWAGRVEWS